MSKSTGDTEAEFGYPHVLEDISLDHPWSMRIVHKYSWQWDIVLEYDHYTDLHAHRIEDFHFRIICDSASGEYIPMLPSVNCMRKPTPEPNEDVEPPAETTRFKKQRDVIVWLRSPHSCDGMSVLDWLADFIERHHFEGIKENVRGAGAVRAQRLYDEYGTVRAFMSQTDEELIDNHGLFDPGNQPLEQLRGRYEEPDDDDDG